MEKYNKLKLEVIIFNSEDVITTSGDNTGVITYPNPQPQPQPQPGGQDGQDNNANV